MPKLKPRRKSKHSGGQAYPKYKDSGVEWLGEIPEGWEERRFKTLFRERNEKGYANETLLAATQRHGVIPKDDYENRTVLALKNLETLKLVEPEDFVVSLRSFQGGIEFSRYRGIVSPAYNVFYSKNNHEISSGYFRYLFKSALFIQKLSNLVTGIREGQNINIEKLVVTEVPLPPFNLQKKMSDYLDHKTTQIDTYIQKLKKEIKLLKEYRQKIISQAVTCGLDKNGNLRQKPKSLPAQGWKDSGVEWLGPIPEDWEVRKLKYVAGKKRTDFIDGDWIESDFITDEGIRYLTTGNVGKGRYVEKGNSYITKATFDYLFCTKVSAGDILISRLNEPIGRSCIVPNLGDTIVTSVDNVILRPRENFDKQFLVYFMSSNNYLTHTKLLGRGATMPRIGRSILGNIKIAFPSLDEQREISTYLIYINSQIDQQIEKIQQQIGYMREYKQSLISKVVTGKVRV